MSPPTLTIGDTQVARIGLGTNRLTTAPEHVEFVRQAVAAGIDHIDTAHLYTGGESERALGEALSSAPQDVLVATKGGYRDAAPDTLRAEIEESLRRLRTETLELYYLHRVDADIPLEESLGAIDEHRQAGKIRHVGLSEVGVAEIERARKVLPIAAVQNEYNVIERQHDDVVDHCAREGIAFVAFYPLHGARRHQVALAWLLQRSPALAAIPGTLSIDHLRENLGALGLELSDEELEALR
jgi:pyridoxine 4-dehydrogenase